MPDGVPDLPGPKDWVIVRGAAECIALLETGEVMAVGLDHHLGANVPTGYEVPAQLYVHTANPVGRGRTLAALRRLEVTVLTVG